MKRFAALSALLAFSALACAADVMPETASDGGMVMEKYTRPGSAIVYRRMVERKAAPEVSMSTVSAPQAPLPTSLSPVAMETYTKPGSAIVYRRPVAGVMTAAAAD